MTSGDKIVALGNRTELTKGKTYIYLYGSIEYIVVHNNIGHKMEYDRSTFISLREHRVRKLINLLK
jgi:hypothetical protein